jgi:hypothetical protein
MNNIKTNKMLTEELTNKLKEVATSFEISGTGLNSFTKLG